VSTAEGAVSWNGFLKEIGFGGSQVYEVSASGILLEGEQFIQVELFCLDGDWVNDDGNPEIGVRIEVDDALIFPLPTGVQATTGEIVEGPPFSRVFPRDVIGQRVFVEYFDNAPGTPQAPFDIPFTVTILCLNPSPFANAIGGDWQPTDTTALIIGYSVLNAYWIAPIGIGIGVGIYLVKRKIE